MAHKPKVMRDKDDQFLGACNCGDNSGPNHFKVRQHAEDWVLKHEQSVQRALAHLHKAPGGLRTDMEHAQKMMDDPNVPAREREQWRVIYEGARNRLGLGTVKFAPDEPELW